MASSTKRRRVVVEFYTNLTVLEGNVVTSTINGVELVFDHIRLGEILKIPINGLVEYVWMDDENCLLTSKFSHGRVSTRARKFEIVHKGILPRGHKKHEAFFRDMGIAYALENMEPIDCPSLMIKHMVRIADPQPSSHQLVYENLISIVFKEFDVSLGEGRGLTRADMLTRSSFAECGLLVEPDQVHIASPRAFGPVASLLRDLKTARDQVVVLQAKNASLLAKLQKQLVKQQIDNNSRMDRVLQLLSSSSSSPKPSP
ncbi:hypothetical protein R3W88_023338 [Solanum pinnatisectum]|uniref:Uncharacterized protein n=1 Tax=Solanum pinnatisectum TaxID=50273 RepID=A0AAV9M052_9SOLN|nr:hypothetical protein R3W88_023338 [Solanum pinnatisectum]